MRISIALASFNGEPFIRDQLRTLINQTRVPDELVVADDGSSDETVEVIDATVAGAGFVTKVLPNISGVPLRPPRNFNRALEQCTGDLVFCCDQDDVWDPHKIATVAKALEDRSDIGCYLNNTRFCDGELRDSGLDKVREIRRAGLPPESFVMGCCAAFRASFLSFALPIPADITHDGWLVGLADLLKICHRSEEVLQSYRIHGGNVSKGFFINSAVSTAGRGRKASRWRKRLVEIRSNQSLLRELVFVRAANERLEARKHEIASAYPSADLGGAMRLLASRLRWLEARSAIRKSSGIRRLRMWATMVYQGGYEGRGSAMDALKDLVVGLDASERYYLWPPSAGERRR